MARILFITGTDTGVGKTVLTALLVRYLRMRGVSVAALKPVCSGGREDALVLRAAMEEALTLDEINPWHFRAPLAPTLAARQEERELTLAPVIGHVRQMARSFEVVLVEGAGGLLSPLGEGFDSRSLICALRAQSIVVGMNRLGAVNQMRLVLAALPATFARRAQVVLMAPPKADAATAKNRALLAEFVPEKSIHQLGRLRAAEWKGRFTKEALGVLEKLAGKIAGLHRLSPRSSRTASAHARPMAQRVFALPR